MFHIHTNIGVIYLLRDLEPHLTHEEDEEPMATFHFIQNLLAHFPDDSNVRYIRARLFDSNIQWDQAVEEYKVALELDPDNHEAYYYLGDLLYRRKRIPEAIPLLLKAAELSPGWYDPWFMLGTIHFKGQEIGKAAGFYQKAIEASPGIAYAHYGLALCHIKAGKYGDATREFGRALYFDPSMMDVRFRMKYLPKLRLSPEEELDSAFYTVEKNPDDPEAHHWLGVVSLLLLARDDHCDDLEKAISLDPDNSCYRYDLAAEHDFSDADVSTPELLNSLLAMDPTYTDALLHLGVFDIDHLNHDEAISVFRRAIELMPGDDLPYYLLGSLYDLINKIDEEDPEPYDEACKALKMAIKLNPENFNAHLMLARIYERARHYDKAIKEYGQVLGIEPCIREAKEKVEKLRKMKTGMA